MSPLEAARTIEANDKRIDFLETENDKLRDCIYKYFNENKICEELKEIALKLNLQLHKINYITSIDKIDCIQGDYIYVEQEEIIRCGCCEPSIYCFKLPIELLEDINKGLLIYEQTKAKEVQDKIDFDNKRAEEEKNRRKQYFLNLKKEFEGQA